MELKKSNCFVFAVKKFIFEGGYLIVRRSRWGPFPHFLWAKSLKGIEVEHLVPINPKKRKFPPLFFKGFIKKED